MVLWLIKLFLFVVHWQLIRLCCSFWMKCFCSSTRSFCIFLTSLFLYLHVCLCLSFFLSGNTMIDLYPYTQENDHVCHCAMCCCFFLIFIYLFIYFFFLLVEMQVVCTHAKTTRIVISSYSCLVNEKGKYRFLRSLLLSAWLLLSVLSLSLSLSFLFFSLASYCPLPWY